jgi:hypothetical protein
VFGSTLTTSSERFFRVAHKATILLLLLLVGCQADNIPAGRILVKNDCQDREFNVISVSGGGSYKSLKPGQSFLMPRGVREFSVTRRYREYTRYYAVKCPEIKKGIRVKLIDIHVNRIDGGCSTVKATKG